MKQLFTILTTLTFFISFTSAQTNLWTEDFETDGEGTRYTNSNTFRDGTADYYTRTDGDNPSISVTGGPYVTSDGDFYFAGEDMDDNGGDGNAFKVFTKTGIDITGYTNLNFKGLFGGGTGGWDVADDQVLVEAQINGGGYTRILSFKQDGSSGSNFNSPLAQDIDGDGLGEGAVLTATLTDFTGAIVGTGTTLDIRITSQCNSGSEEFAFDFLRVEGLLPSSDPEIDVQSSTATSIPDGDTTPSTAEETDFGLVDVAITVTNTLTIKNIGGADLSTGMITISGTDAADFAIANYTPGIITVGGSATFDIEFTPSSVGIKNATVSIVNNDLDENPYEFDITGEGFSLEKIAITEFFTNPIGVEVNSEFVEIYNYGTTPVDLNGWRIKDEDADDDIISTTSLIIAAGEYLVLAANKTPYEANWLNGAVCPNVIEVGIGLANGTDEIILENANGDVVWSLAYGNDDSFGSATHYTESTYTNRFWGSKASPGVDRSGNDVTGTLGYQKNIITADPLAFSSNDGDTGSPLNQTACYENEIDIQGGSGLTSIVNGDNTPETADGTETIAIIGIASMQTFTIENEGLRDLIVSNITSNNGDFTISGATFPLVISGGMTATFTLEYTSSAIGMATATITVANDDADEGTYTFDVRGVSPGLTAGDDCTTAVATAVDASGTMVHFLDASNQLIASVSSTGTDFSALGDEISISTKVGSPTSNGAVDGNPYLIMGRQFNIESIVAAPYTGLTVRLYFNNSDYSDLSGVSCPTCPPMTDPSTNVEISHYDGNNQNCDQSDNDYATTPSENLGGAYGTYGATAFYMEVNPTHFSEFFGHQTNNIVFPVELTSFTGKKSGQNNVLNWQTATEINNEFFVIEKRDDVLGWMEIGTINGAGNSSEPTDYSFIDKNVSHTQYYRLKQIDFDGTFAYSDIVNIVRKADTDTASEFYPNPSRAGSTYMDYVSTKNEKLLVSGFDVNGRLVFREVRTVANGDNQLRFDFQSLKKGLYIITLQTGQQQIQRKLMLD